MATIDSDPIQATAGADLSARKFRFGKISAGLIVACSVAGERADGVIGSGFPTASASGAGVDFYIERVAKIEAGGTFSAGDPLTTDTVGRAVVATAGSNINGYALEAGSVGKFVAMLFPRSAAPVASNVANANVSPGSLVVHQFEIADAATADYDITITDKIEVLDVLVQKTAGAGGAVNTVQMKSTASAISDVMSINIADTTLARALTINDANSVIVAGGILRASVIKAGGNAACKITVIGIKRA